MKNLAIYSSIFIVGVILGGGFVSIYEGQLQRKETFELCDSSKTKILIIAEQDSIGCGEELEVFVIPYLSLPSNWSVVAFGNGATIFLHSDHYQGFRFTLPDSANALEKSEVSFKFDLSQSSGSIEPRPLSEELILERKMGSNGQIYYKARPHFEERRWEDDF